ncbi:Holliday junction DNA helicase RuvA [Candidatus Gottesmanbacteria bacterium RBG_16_37_8]|uniref:Holliday junction branch migration complex subunit RuvA n=1 Tax=Candidatus Gottesmanbacteria bacterium RBG_16_37_8 TaxID=1798371 RepID=A0A1F5YUT3_9BACT|nr:MAG: Holliday junction DNA helicase RuvA [Candidatus Gottesmanbacteria bacterium RBG_16_37_8]
MISYLEGIVKLKGPSYLIIMTSGGVGYKIHTPVDLITHANLNKPLSIFTYTHVRDDALDLYGFTDPENLAFFELFLTVSGIGPKLALSIFSIGKLTKIKEAIIKGDISFFTAVPRLGKKNAQKLIIELRPKLGSLSDLDLSEDSGETKGIIDALHTFGFSTVEAREAIKSIATSEGSTSDKIRQALKYLGKK